MFVNMSNENYWSRTHPNNNIIYIFCRKFNLFQLQQVQSVYFEKEN